MKKTITQITLLTIGSMGSIFSASVQTANGSDGFGVFSSFGAFSSVGVAATGSSGVLVYPTAIGNAWTFIADDSEYAEAFYDFSGGALSIGQTLSFQMHNSFIHYDITVGFELQSIANGNNRFETYFSGTGSDYVRYDSGGSSSTGVGSTSSGLTIDFTLTSADTYSINITPIGSETTNLTGTLSGTAGSGIDRLRFFNENHGLDLTSDVSFNNISIAAIPEPSSAALLGLGGLALILRRRK